MASIYQRPDSQNYYLSCYPHPGAKLVRASLGTENQAEAEKVARTVELLIELEKYSNTKVPVKVLDSIPGVRSMIGICNKAVVVTSSDESVTIHPLSQCIALWTFFYSISVSTSDECLQSHACRR
jgi:hypothetical protein